MLRVMQIAQRLIGWERMLYFTLQRWSERRTRRVARQKGAKPPARHLLTGQRGEDEAFFWLRGLGYTVVARRWRSERLRGDLDLVAWDGDTLVIVEVKTLTAASSAEAFRPAEWQVDRDKQRMLRRMAAAYRRQMPERWRDRCVTRYDVVSVYLGSGEDAGLRPAQEPVFEHFRAAFSAAE